MVLSLNFLLIIITVLRDKFKTKVAGRIGNNDKKDVKIIVLWKYLRNFWRELEMPLISCEINPILPWSANYFIIDARIANKIPVFTIRENSKFQF